MCMICSASDFKGRYKRRTTAVTRLEPSGDADDDNGCAVEWDVGEFGKSFFFFCTLLAICQMTGSSLSTLIATWMTVQQIPQESCSFQEARGLLSRVKTARCYCFCDGCDGLARSCGEIKTTARERKTRTKVNRMCPGLESVEQHTLCLSTSFVFSGTTTHQSCFQTLLLRRHFPSVRDIGVVWKLDGSRLTSGVRKRASLS